MPPTIDPASVVTDRREYAAHRAADRDRMIALRRLRRLRLGDQLLVEFENAQTLQYQVQEMVYVEGITAPAEVAHEVAAYSRLLPTSHELAATLLVELDDPQAVRAQLQRLVGLQHTVSVEVGGARVPGVELPPEDEEEPADATHSVHFLRFRFTDEQRDAFRDPAVPARLVVDHPEYADDVAIEGETRLSLLADLSLDG